MSRTYTTPIGGQVGNANQNVANVLVNFPPTLIANTDEPYLQTQPSMPEAVGSNLALEDPSDVNVYTPATTGVTVGGTVTSTDILTLTFGGPSILNGRTASYEVQATDSTLAMVAEGLAAAVNTAFLGILLAEAAGAVITISYKGGLAGNTVTVVGSVTLGSTETLTVSDSPMIGGVGPVQALRTFQAKVGFIANPTTGVVIEGTFRSFLEGHYYNLDAGTVAALVASGMPIL